jgi:hypothetical protein
VNDERSNKHKEIKTMTRFASFALIGAATLGFSLSAPETARAQSFGLHVDVGRAHLDIGHGHGHRHGHHRHSYYDYGHSHRHDGYYGYGDSYYAPYRPTIVVPDYYHWTPGRGYHSHGTIVTPHRGHYHERRY